MASDLRSGALGVVSNAMRDYTRLSRCLLVYLYLVNLSTKESGVSSSEPCGKCNERRDVILWRLISMREIHLACTDALFVVV